MLPPTTQALQMRMRYRAAAIRPAAGFKTAEGEALAVEGRLAAATGAEVDAVAAGGDTLTAVQAVRPAACRAAAVGGVANAAVTVASDAVVAATENDTATDEASRWRPAAEGVTSVTPVTMIDAGVSWSEVAMAALKAVACAVPNVAAVYPASVAVADRYVLVVGALQLLEPHTTTDPAPMLLKVAAQAVQVVTSSAVEVSATPARYAVRLSPMGHCVDVVTSAATSAAHVTMPERQAPAGTVMLIGDGTEEIPINWPIAATAAVGPVAPT